MKINEIPSTKNQIPGPDRIYPYGINYLSLKSHHGWWFKPIKSHQGGLKQISMTQIQNSKQIIPLQSCPAVSSPADLGLRNDAIRLRWMFWSLIIEICDLFVIWCLRFGILMSYKTFWCNWFRIYFDVTLNHILRGLQIAVKIVSGQG